jgi:CheY-like chemotaxis protein
MTEDSDADLHGLRLLVLEDEMMVLLLVEDMLTDLGCTVVGPASSVAAALQLVAAEAIDAALLDVNLGHGESGYPVAEQLAARGIPFAFVTGYGADVLPDRFRGRPTLQKPFQMAALRRVVGDLARAGRRDVAR